MVKVNEFYTAIEDMVMEDFQAFTIALIMYEKKVTFNEAKALYEAFMEDDTRTSLISIED